MEYPTAKNFAQDKAKEIINLCNDLKYINDRELRMLGIEKIYKLADGILDHLEYLDIAKEDK